MQEIISRKAETALLVCFRLDGQDDISSRSISEELEQLVRTMGLEAVRTIIVPHKKTNPRFITGSGKAEEICDLADELDVDCIVFDDDISPSQQRNWEEKSGRCVIDRQEVILDIFAARAITREAMLQVGLARMQYSLPRLTRAWTHLSRQRGGTRGTRGEGETQLEIDRRMVMRKIAKIKKELASVERERQTQRKKRKAVPVPTASIVGYTNAGKSSLLNALTNADVLVENKLFATLDATTRRVRLPGGFDALLSDTVGFIRRLPHGLVEAFKSTLEEVVYADFIIHLIDISSGEFREHIDTTNSVLRELGASGKKCLLVFNKTDIAGSIEVMQKEFPEAVFISVKTGAGLDALAAHISEAVFNNSKVLNLAIPGTRGDLKALLHREAVISSEEFENGCFCLTAAIPKRLLPVFSQYIIKNNTA
ncbi:MAG: GTPase HflX [Spirochaetales bacterium]|nr:GTPase HflX [Spirochaetales bacterium]